MRLSVKRISDTEIMQHYKILVNDKPDNGFHILIYSCFKTKLL